ncbi:YajQ family cyclic di-GMP-binding protein [Synechococcus sp. BDU 130192]|uniref:YajQ family cyclic di-GMP-binding protein n=1 Tax=Synechococcus sp. BDU 130192 TaxID=2042059 RepID=UPI000C07B72D|nr:YajQ family cyclic di-GMP-binding protein [Synechococcus sp. BDU 130192]
MASTNSFDVVSDFDRQEVVNTIDQALRDINTRYDLKDTKTTIELGENTITINTASDFTLDAVQTILVTKAIKRNLSPKLFDYGEAESASGGRVRQVITLRQGISKDDAKKITKMVKTDFKKVQASIQGDAVRISSKSKDDLQAVMQAVRDLDFPMPIQFTNYR